MNICSNKTLNLFFILVSVILFTIQIYPQAPSISYSTIIGGSNADYGHAITVDDKGFAYIAGQANSSNYPTTNGAYDRTHNGGADIFLTKLNQNGSGLVYSTYIGGSGRDDTRWVFIDRSGSIYLTGGTTSNNFPTTNNSLQGNSENYFLKLDSTGSNLRYSSRWAGGDRVLLDSEGNLIIIGTTNSATFPTTENAYSRTLAGGNDIFVAKIDITTNTILFSTLIGGNGDEGFPNPVIDKNNNIIIAGQTRSGDFPVKGSIFSSDTSNKSNVFVLKLKSDGTDLIYSTIVGGNDDEWAFDIGTDVDGNAFVTGGTRSDDFPVSDLAFDLSYNQGDDAFLFKINPDGSQLVYSTYIGGSSKDGGRGLVVAKDGKVYLTGCTKSTDFPTSEDAYDTTFNGAGTESWAWGDPFLLVMNPEGTDIEYSTYLGGRNDEEAYGIAMDKNLGVYICGITSSNNFPTTDGAYDRSINGYVNIYVVKFQFTNKIDYFGHTPPQDTPVLFSVYPPGNFPELHSCPSFSPLGEEAFWATWTNLSDYNQTIYYRNLVNGQWSVPETAFFSGGGYSDKLPCFSGDGQRVYFTSNRPLSGNGNPIDENIWYIEKTDTGWSNPICLDSNVNSSKEDAWISIAANNNLYFGRSDSFYLAKWENDHFLQATPISEIPGNMDLPISIAPDESYIILGSDFVLDSHGNYINDLYIITQKNGIWLSPVKLDSKINSMKSKSFLKISPDGKYLFFLGDSNKAYWVSTDFVNNITSIETDHKIDISSDFNLYQNYPNPFNPSTVISYLLPEAGNVKLKIYNTLGEEITTLVDAYQSAGAHSKAWNAKDKNNSSVCSGVYFCNLTINNHSFSKKMILLQ